MIMINRKIFSFQIFNLILLFLVVPIINSQDVKQNIRGRVYDADTRSPLTGAVIEILDRDSVPGILSGDDGGFLLSSVPSGRYNIKVSLEGYKPAVISEVSVGSGKEVYLEISLVGSAISTDVIEVTAFEDKGKPLNPMALLNAHSFTVDETSRYAGALDDPLRSVTNFAGVTANPSINSNEISVRGNSSKGLLWKLEGIDIPNPNHFGKLSRTGGGLTIFSSQMLSNSDFFISAFPSEYGNAIGGVFDMHFRTGSHNKREFGIQLGIQGIEAVSEGPFVKGNESSYLINYRYSTLGLLSSFFPEIQNGIPNYQDLALKLKFPTQSFGVFSVTGIWGLSRQSLNAEPDSANWLVITDRQFTHLKTMMGALILSHNYIWGASTSLNTSIAFSDSEIDWENGYVNSGYKNKMTEDVNFTNKRVSLNSVLTHKFSPEFTSKTGFVISGLLYKTDLKGQDPLGGDFIQIAKDDGNTLLAELFTSSRLETCKNFSIIPGLRFSYFLLNKHFSLEPRLAMKWNITQSHSVSVGFGMHSQLENISVYLAQKQDSALGVTIPNKNLDFTKSVHFTAGYQWKAAGDLRIKIEPYYQYLYNIPSAQSGSFTLLNYSDIFYNDSLNNNGRGRNYGVDMTVEKFLNNGYYGVFTASFYRSKYTGSDGIERNTKFNGGYAFNLLFGGEIKVFSSSILGMNLKLNYAGGERYIPILLEQSISEGREVLDYENAYSMQYPSFLYADLSVSLRTNYKHWSGILSLQVKNLFNRRVSNNYMYDSFSKSIYDDKTTGILPFISYRVEF